MRLFALKVPSTVSEDVFDRLLRQLPEPEHEGVRKFRHEGDAIRCGKLLPIYYLRTASYVQPSQHPRFERGQRGKPFLADPVIPGFDFNISHEGDYVLLAVAHGAEGRTDIGVNVMDRTNSGDLAEAIDFQVAALLGEKKSDLLSTLWTIKEAYVKATGDGISFGLERIEAVLEDESMAVWRVTVDGKDIRERGWTWTMGSIESYQYAVVWRGEDGSHETEVERVAWVDFVEVFIGSRT